MVNTLHIVSGCAAGGTLKYYFKEVGIDEDVLAFKDTLRHAPIFRDFSDKELQNRSQNIELLFGKWDYLDYYTELYDFIHYDFDRYEKIVIWHGNSVDDRLLLYMACSLINGDLYYVDISEIKDLFPHLCKSPFLLSLGACSIADTGILYGKIKPISSELKQQYIAEWNRWSASDASLRIVDSDNNIVEVGEDYFDELILSNCTSEYNVSARVIGKTLCDSNFLVGDSFLLKRIISLITQNKLSACNNDKFSTEIEESNSSDKNEIVINGVNVTQMRFFSIKLR